ncbi:unnamed protein product [Caenorhabditis auriculariae]|uniref:G-protein coupled receptors family 1 profile domain-containing protein n=1 Tax=Caenorhabditis auriculariae TaxID=2777116 RepID=A0A8S1HB75_9PELO|nr:unnamed protein product [Caenorhabditis auriculariae]
MSDLFYILGYNWSNIRFILSYGYEIGVTTRGDCSGRVIAWVNIIAAQLVGEMTLITAVDRVIATCRPFWHYARTPRYSVLLCLVPLVLCTCTAIVNYILVQTSDAKDQEVTVMCFSFSLTTLNSLLFLLVPDVVSNYTGYGNIPVFLITTSIMLNKITFNFVLFMAYHKELRRIYVAIFYLFTASRSHTDRVITL